MRTDPTDNGGLFVGRRPGTAPVKYRELPETGGEKRRVVDRLLAGLILLAMLLVNLLFWGPLPAAWLWVGSQVDFHTGSVSWGILTAFAGLLFSLLAGLVVLRWLDHAWILVRRAAGYDQREGVIGKMFAITCAIGVTAFTIWLLFFSGARLSGGGVPAI
jgi:hypothetical protein